MGHFINDNVYDLFPAGVTEKLKEVNPLNPSGSRSRKHHQHLTQNIGLPLLDYQKGVTIAVMRLSPSGSTKKFKQNMQKACGNQIQIEMPFMDEFEPK
jgi:P63C domain